MSMPPTPTPLINGGVAVFIIHLQTNVNSHQLPSGTLITPKAIRRISWMVSVGRREKNFQDLSEDNRHQREKMWLIWGCFSNIKWVIGISEELAVSHIWLNLPSCYGLVGNKMEKLSNTGYPCFAELCNSIIWLKPSDTTWSFSRVCKPFTPTVTSSVISSHVQTQLTDVCWVRTETNPSRQREAI